jgi:hypothetical protein
MKQNCWEFKKCGREPGGEKEKQLGPCPVPGYTAMDGLHGGKNSGRACWAIAGSLCGGKVQGDEEQKRKVCWECEFFKLVKKEEETTSLGFSHTRLGMDRTVQKMRAR